MQAGYPLPLRGIILARGAEHVAAVCEEALGYPLTWVESLSECMALIRAVDEQGTKGARQ